MAIVVPRLGMSFESVDYDYRIRSDRRSDLGVGPI